MTAKRMISRSAALILGLTQSAAVIAFSLMTAQPAAAQGFFDDRYPFMQDRFRRQAPVEEEKPPDYSRAPAPKKAETPPTSTVMVFGDAMADWLAYGLEDAFSDTPEIGIVRKHKTYSGLVRYENRRDNPEWPQVAREAIAADKPSFVLMMLGVSDRQSLREAPPPPPAKPATPTPAAPAGRGAAGAQTATPATPPAAAAKSDQQAAAQPDDAEQQPAVVAPEPARGSNRPAVGQNHEYRSEKWEELYIKRIDDTITALKSSGVPVYWVGLPPLRGTRSTADMQYLDDLYRNRAEKAGIVYIEVWDGFVDETGRFNVQGPDFEGQIRRLRTSDGVYFTKAGARKLAHYVEREIRRDLNHVLPVALPVPEEPAPALAAKPSAPAVAALPAAPVVPARPLVGPVMPLSATSAAEPEELLGGSAPRPSTDNPAGRVLVKGEPVTTTAGRADDFAWPPRAPTTDFAGPLPAGPVIAAAPPKPAQPQQPPTRQAAVGGGAAQPGAPQQNRVAQQPQLYPRSTPGPYWRSPPSAWGGGGGGGGFFGLFR